MISSLIPDLTGYIARVRSFWTDSFWAGNLPADQRTASIPSDEDAYGISEGYTKPTTGRNLNQLFSCYAKVGDAEPLLLLSVRMSSRISVTWYLVKLLRANLSASPRQRTEASPRPLIKAGNFWDFFRKKSLTESIRRSSINTITKQYAKRSEVIEWIRIPFPPRET